THAPCRPNVHRCTGMRRPAIHVRVSAADDHTTTMPPGEPGELMVRGPLVMIGYYNNAAATAEAVEPDGWLHTGDIAYADDEGHFFIVDRKKDMLITSGNNVYPA